MPTLATTLVSAEARDKATIDLPEPALGELI